MFGLCCVVLCKLNWKEIIGLLSAIITAGGVIFGVFTFFKSKQRENQINSINELNRIFQKYPNVSPYAPKKERVSAIQRKQYLKEMERFCTGVNCGIYDFDIIMAVCGRKLVRQYDSYMADIIHIIQKKKITRSYTVNTKKLY